jgi:hypothetical protein
LHRVEKSDTQTTTGKSINSQSARRKAHACTRTIVAAAAAAKQPHGHRGLPHESHPLVQAQAKGGAGLLPGAGHTGATGAGGKESHWSANDNYMKIELIKTTCVVSDRSGIHVFGWL